MTENNSSQNTSTIPNTSTADLNLDTTHHLLNHLWRGGNWGLFWTDKGHKSHWQKTDAAIPALNGRKNYYFGVHPTSADPEHDPAYKPQTKRTGQPKPVRNAYAGTQSGTVSAVNCLFGEYDAKDFDGGLPAALNHIEQLAQPPSVIIFSGGGYHCYWLLRDTFVIDDNHQRAYIDDIQKRWVGYVGSDQSAKDLARMLRVPGTTNYKTKYAPAFPTVTTIHADFDHLYDLAELVAVLPQVEPTHAPAANPYTPPTNKSEQERAQNWAATWFSKRYTDLLATTTGSRNERLYDLAFLAGQLIGIGLLNRGEIEPALDTAAAQLEQSTATVRSGLSSGLTAEPNWLPDFDTTPTQQKQARQRKQKQRRKSSALEEQIEPVTLPSITGHLHVNLPYISDLPIEQLTGQAITLIKSPLGTGKTELMKRLIAALGESARILVITHRNALITNIGTRLSIPTHINITTGMLHADRLVITPNSLHKIDTSHPYDLVVIDEIEQVLPHLIGGTFKRGESYHAHGEITTLLCNARHVIGLDAHLSNVSALWIHERTGKTPQIIVNNYQPDRGQLTLFKDKYAIIATIRKTIEKQRGTVTIPCASKNDAEKIHHYLCSHFGSSSGVLITSENSNSPEIQAFIQNINGPSGITSLRWLVTTSTFGTGLDVQAPVYAVFGVFINQPLLASDMMQMLMRYRNAQHYTAYVQHYHASDPRDHLDIAGTYLDAAAATRQAADFATHGIVNVAPGHHSLLRLHGRITVNATLQRSDLASYFVAFAQAEGFNLVFNNTQANRTRNAFKEIHEQMLTARKNQTMTATAIDQETFDAHREAGTVTPAIQAGYLRWQIEHTVGLDLTDNLYDDLHQPSARRALCRLADVIGYRPALQERDRLEATENVLLFKRGHYTTTRDLIVDGLTLVFGKDWQTSEQQFTTEHLQACGFTNWVKNHLAQIQRLIDNRDDLSTDPLFVLRRLLATIKLKLDRRQKMVNGTRFMIYWLDSTHREKWVGYAQARLASKKMSTINAKNIELSANTVNPPYEASTSPIPYTAETEMLLLATNKYPKEPYH